MSSNNLCNRGEMNPHGRCSEHCGECGNDAVGLICSECSEALNKGLCMRCRLEEALQGTAMCVACWKKKG